MASPCETEAVAARELPRDEAGEDSGWRAELRLRLRDRDGITRLAERWHRGPLRIQKPFYPRPGGACQLVLLHPPGGVVGGDQLSIDISLETGARALVTTPGATKFYRSAGREALLQTRIQVASGAALEWTPQESILFDDSLSRIETRVELDPGASFLAWELTALGRPAAEAPFARGRCRQSLELYRGGEPLFIDRNEYRGGSRGLASRWALAGYEALGLMVCTGCDEDSLASALEMLPDVDREGPLVAATRRGDLVILRALAPQARTLFEIFGGLREVLSRDPSPKARIWAT